MSKDKISACPYCESECDARGSTVICTDHACEYSYHRWGNTLRENIAAHNAIARRIDPARLLMIIGGMKGAATMWMSWADKKGFGYQYREHLSEIIMANSIMDKIRAMAKEQEPKS